MSSTRSTSPHLGTKQSDQVIGIVGLSAITALGSNPCDEGWRCLKVVGVAPVSTMATGCPRSDERVDLGRQAAWQAWPSGLTRGVAWLPPFMGASVMLVSPHEVAEARRKVRPRDARAIAVENSLDEQPIVSLAVYMALSAGRRSLIRSY